MALSQLTTRSYYFGSPIYTQLKTFISYLFIMKLDTKNPFDTEQFVQDNAIYYQEKFEEYVDGRFANNPDKFSEREQENQEQIIDDMTEAYKEILRNNKGL